MSDPKPDRILAEESDNPWVKLILWAHEDPVRPTDRWNGFMKYLVEESDLGHLTRERANL